MKIFNFSSIGETDRRSDRISIFSLSFSDPKDEKKYQQYINSLNTSFKRKCLYVLSGIFNIFVYLLYLVFYLLNSENIPSKSLLIQILLISFLVSVQILFVFLTVYSKKFGVNSLKNTVIIYALSCSFLILNDIWMEQLIFGVNFFQNFSSLFGILVFGITSQKFLTFHEYSIANLIIGPFYIITSLLKSSQTSNIFEVVILGLALLYEIIYKYIQEYNKKKFFLEKNKDTSEIQESILQNLESSVSDPKIQDCIDDLIKISPFTKSRVKQAIEKVIKVLLFLPSESKAKLNLNALSNNLDDEDLLYLQQSYLPPVTPAPNSQKKVQFTESVDTVILKAFNDNNLLLLKQVSTNWNMNMFDFDEQTQNNPIRVMGTYCLKFYNLMDTFRIDESKAQAFFSEIQNNYKKNPYHNAIHGADVLNSALFFVSNSKLSNFLSSLDMLCIIISCIAHDVGHPGFTNRFLINIQDTFAVRCNFYADNDISVLENMHAALTFSFLQDKDKNILENLEKNEFLSLRKWAIEIILATDMSRHFDMISVFRSKGYLLTNLDNIDCKLDVFRLLIHTADIGHSAKSSELHILWSNLVSQEFFNQGDIEKNSNMPVSMYCDRETTILPKSQIGFLKNIALPLFEVMCEYLNSENINYKCLEQIKINISNWESELIVQRKKTVKNFPNFTQDSPFPRSILGFSSLAY